MGWVNGNTFCICLLKTSSKGDQSTSSGASLPGSSTPMNTETEEDDLEALEKAVEAEFNKGMIPAASESIHPSEVETLPLPPPVEVQPNEPPLPPSVEVHEQPPLPPPVEALPAVPKQPEPVFVPKTPPPTKPITSPKTSDVSGNLARALMGGGGLMPSQLFSPELEQDAQDTLNKLSEGDFEKRLEEAKVHPEYKSYCEGVRMEIGETGDEPEPWVFGDQEPFLDLVGFLVWVKARENMRKALGVVTPSPPPLPKQGAPATTLVPPEVPKADTSPPAVPKQTSPPAAPKTAPRKVTFVEHPKVIEAPAAPKTTSPAAPEPAPTTPSPSELSSVVDTTVALAANPKPTSTTHRKEYMAFLRAANNPYRPHLLKNTGCVLI